MTKSPRSYERTADQPRPIEFVRRFTDAPPGSVLVRCGRTHVLCTATVSDTVPAWREASGFGWLTSEYEMLPGSTGRRKERTRKHLDGRTQEIQRLIGRSIRAVVNLEKLGSRTIHVDCDVLQADGGTRTTAINGAFVAVADAIALGVEENWWPADALCGQVAAISVGLVRGEILVDLDYREDVSADVDCNLVRTNGAEWIEVQGTGERGGFTDEQLHAFLAKGAATIDQIFALQTASLACDVSAS